MKNPQMAAPSPLNRMLQAADAAWERSDFQECIDTLQRALRLAPANTTVLLKLGRVHGLRYDYAAAAQCFEKALRLAPRKTEMLAAIGDQCLAFNKLEMAEHYLRDAVASSDAPPQTFVILASVYERLRRLPEATQMVQRALNLDPACPDALLVEAHLEGLAGRLEAAEQGLRRVAHPKPANITHVHAWYELAALLDRQKRFDEAMEAFATAKSFFLPQATRQLAELKIVRTRLKAMESEASPELFQRWIQDASELMPPRKLALLTGHPRSGTTLLEQVLDSHPGIVSAEETPIFAEDAFALLRRNLPPDAYMLSVLQAANPVALQQSRAAYFRSMEMVLGGRIADRLLIDKNPALNFMIPAFVRIFPETKFIVALRDPRDVVLSCYMQNLHLSQMGAAYLTLQGTVDDYANLMSIWLTLKPMLAGHFLELRYEDMVEDLESVVRKTLNFLDVPWDPIVLGFHEHARKKAIRSHTFADATQPVYKRAKGRWRNYQKYLEPHLEKLEPFVKAFGYE